jgi:hypothetical protein
MAKIKKVKIPLSAVQGKFGITDASRGLDTGMQAEIRYSYPNNVYVAPKKHTRTRSAAQIARSSRYCLCDQRWKEIGSQKMANVRAWYMWTYGLKSVHLSNYHLWMRVCLNNSLEGDLFFPFCWAGRYIYRNTGTSVIPAQPVALNGVPFRDPSGTDNEVHQLRGLRMDSEPVPRTVVAPGRIIIAGPSLQPGSFISYMVYAYADL